MKQEIAEMYGLDVPDVRWALAYELSQRANAPRGVSRVKPAEIRFYVDADLLGLARVLASLRPDVTYPGDPGALIHNRSRPPCPIASPGVKYTQWIPEVSTRGWLIITRDRHIQEHRLEIAAVREHRAP